MAEPGSLEGMATKSGNESPTNKLVSSDTMKFLNSQVNQAKLLAKSLMGQINESNDDPDVVLAFKKLDTYKEQINALFKTAQAWTQNMNKTWHSQSNFMEQLNISHSVIKQFNVQKNNSNNDNNNNNDNSGVSLDNSNKFIGVVKGISKSLKIEKNEAQQRYKRAQSLLVIPLNKILKGEIQHAIEMRKKYIKCKRMYDDNCTSIMNIKQKIKDIENPTQNEQKVSSVFDKFRVGVQKMVQTKKTKNELENELTLVRLELPRNRNGFEQAKTQLLESIDIIEQKLNIEIVHYVEQFYKFIQLLKKDAESIKTVELDVNDSPTNNDKNILQPQSIINNNDNNNELKVPNNDENNDVPVQINNDGHVLTNTIKAEEPINENILSDTMKAWNNNDNNNALKDVALTSDDNDYRDV